MLENKGDNFIAGLMIGGLIGVSVALLLAPQAGEETRAEIKNKSMELKDETMKRLQGELDKSQQRVAEALIKNKSVELKEQTVQRLLGALETSQQRAVEALGYGKERVIEAISRGKDNFKRTMSPGRETVIESVIGEAEQPV